MIGPITPFTINKYYWGLERREIRDRVSISCSMDTRVRWNETMNYIFRHTPGWTGQFVEHVILYRYSEKNGGLSNRSLPNNSDGTITQH